jgi:hypothetical protein
MLQSHAARDAEFAGIEASQEAAEGLIQSILQNPSRVVSGRQTVDAYNTSGQGVRLELSTGRFQTFVNATDATR